VSKNVACSCLPNVPSHWRVKKRKHNNSAFNGRRHTPSDYSEVVCLRCNGSWRTKADYVDKLKDYFA
jgi:hypothetical protein